MTSIPLGNALIQRVEEKTMAYPIEVIAPEEDFVKANERWLIPNFLDPVERSFDFTLQSWLVQIDDKIIVIDPCNGNGRERPVFPFFNHLDTPYLERFEATGIRPEDVDIVFCTHLHCDHCGWNTKMSNGRWVPTFPNARYLFVKREFERWDPKRPDHEVVDYNVGVFEDSVLPIIEAGLADLVTDTHTVTPNITIEPAYGHTYGHSILRIVTGDKQALFTGDVFHHPLQTLRPECHLPGCDDLESAIATRYAIRERCALTGALILPAHFSAPHAGYVEHLDGKYFFKALGSN